VPPKRRQARGDAGPLSRYRAKRHPGRSGEPGGQRVTRREDGHPLQFVVQQHDATAMHYDFRLEHDGVLKSWAVPRGPSADPQVKRLAMPTEDHPLDYASFEGVIPAGEYGGGPVIVWDTGTWCNETEHNGDPVDAGEALRRGHLRFRLDGRKLHGAWALTRTGGARGSGSGGDRERWLLVKVNDQFADGRSRAHRLGPESVRSGRTIAELDDAKPDGTESDSAGPGDTGPGR